MRCHGTALQKLRYIPISLLYNLGQGLWKRQLSPFLRAARDGLGALPPSLQNPIKSNNPDYVARVHRVGQWTNAASLIRNVVSRLRGTL